jgi:hypothetical protein
VPNCEWYLLLTKYYSGDEINKNETSIAHGMFDREKKCIQVSGGKKPGKRDYLENLSISGSTTRKWILR